ncbi:MAG TPA: copper homeostasis protein CutC [Granulicella sp.]|nr:copper homeostasis protein CutC [Granulicella sp.]
MHGAERGGLTPSHGLIREAVRRSGLPVHVLLRPRGGDFVYSAAELDVMREDLEHARRMGASGVVLGVLHPDGTVDTEKTREFVAMAGALEVTFHRAFDDVVCQEQALEEVIAAGCRRVLSSGGEPDVVRGVESLARLGKLAAGRIDVAVGGGLRLNNAAAVARATRARHFHGSLRRVANLLEGEDTLSGMRFTVASNDVRQMVETLRNA